MRLLVFFLCITTLLCGDATLKNRLLQARKGDFIVTAQGDTYSLLFIRGIDTPCVTLEELSIAKELVDLKKVNWQQWVEKKGLGALSWVTFTIDLETNTFKQCYSYLRHQWFLIEKSSDLFSKLFSLSFRPTPKRERKRVGPPPMPGETDRRKLWKPQLIREGKKEPNPKFAVLRTTWPKDDTKLAGCIFELYLDAKKTDFPFPYWLEVQSPHYTFKMRAVDSGSGIQSPMPSLKL